MTRPNHIGYINRTIYTDVNSYEVFEENGKTYAVQVEKRVGDVKPEFQLGGFCAHCSNQRDVWRESNTIEEVDDPFEIEQRKGVWGYQILLTERYRCDDEHIEYVKQRLDEEGHKILRIGKHPIHSELTVIVAYRPTKTGKIRRRWIKLGTIEKECRYFYDYNF